MDKTKRTIKIVYLTLHIFYILELITINALKIYNVFSTDKATVKMKRVLNS